MSQSYFTMVIIDVFAWKWVSHHVLIYTASSLVYGVIHGNITSYVNVTLQQETNAKMLWCNNVLCPHLFPIYLTPKEQGESIIV